jgi:hypothetical protein
LRAFRDLRMGKVIAGDAPAAVAPHPTLLIHVAPVGHTFLESRLDPRLIGDRWQPLVRSQFVRYASERITSMVWPSPLSVLTRNTKVLTSRYFETVPSKRRRPSHDMTNRRSTSSGNTSRAGSSSSLTMCVRSRSRKVSRQIWR